MIQHHYQCIALSKNVFKIGKTTFEALIGKFESIIGRFGKHSIIGWNKKKSIIRRGLSNIYPKWWPHITMTTVRPTQTHNTCVYAPKTLHNHIIYSSIPTGYHIALHHHLHIAPLGIGHTVLHLCIWVQVSCVPALWGSNLSHLIQQAPAVCVRQCVLASLANN